MNQRLAGGGWSGVVGEKTWLSWENGEGKLPTGVTRLSVREQHRSTLESRSLKWQGKEMSKNNKNLGISIGH